ncbi:MAG: hypothetical protein NC336_00550, partial [Clostridium sp.]|nr:hypothetical protein [Clostridium sp.]
RGRELAQQTGARFVPGDPAGAVSFAVSSRGVVDMLVVVGDDIPAGADCTAIRGRVAVSRRDQTLRGFHTLDPASLTPAQIAAAALFLASPAVAGAIAPLLISGNSGK